MGMFAINFQTFAIEFDNTILTLTLMFFKQRHGSVTPKVYIIIRKSVRYLFMGSFYRTPQEKRGYGTHLILTDDLTLFKS